VQDLLHLERGRDRLDQHGGADGADRDTKLLLGVREDVVPEGGLFVGLHLRQVEVRSGAAFQQLLGVVEEVEAEVDQGSHGRLAVHRQVPLVEVPAARAHHDRRVRPAVELVRLLLGLERDRAPDRVVEVLLAVDHVGPVRGVRVLQVGQPHLGARVERVDRHLPLGRAGDLHTPIPQVSRGGRGRPLGRADVRGLGQEAQRGPGRDLRTARGTRLEELVTARPEAPVQVGDKCHGLVGQDLGHR
jgi:hypothetical protein